MKIKNNMRFPFPVLGPLTEDYTDSDFSFEKFSAIEDRNSWNIIISGAINIGSNEIKSYIIERKAKCVIYITCNDTYYSSCEEIDIDSWKIIIPSGKVKGKVQIRPIIYTSEDKLNLQDEKINPEFGNEIIIPEFSPIAIGLQAEFTAGYEKLAPMESIFKLIKSNDIPDGSFDIQLDNSTIDILVSPSIHKIICNLRGNVHTRNMLLSSIYLPAVMQIFSALSKGYLSEQRWVKVFKERCDSFNINYSNDDEHLKNAQKILSNPLMLLEDAIRGLAHVE
ncbi:hypothetical protein AB6T09_02350 [Serratia marcescens]